MVVDTLNPEAVPKTIYSAEDMMNGNFQEKERRSSPTNSPSGTTTPPVVEEDEVPENVVQHYSSMDVLCGTNNYNHPGNRRFRSIIDANLQRYVDAPARADKTKVVCAVLQEIVSTGNCRFLKQDKNKKWHELDKQASKTKVGHALRVKSRFLPKSKDLAAAAAAANELTPQFHHHHHHHHHHLAPNAANNTGGGPNPTSLTTHPEPNQAPTNMGGFTPNNPHHVGMMQPQQQQHTQHHPHHHQQHQQQANKQRFLNMFLQDDSMMMKKPMHPQQYQYQFTTDNARLMMSNELMKMDGMWNHHQHQSCAPPMYGNLEPAPISSLHNNNNNNDGISEVDMDDAASNASSDDSDFLERINELPLSSFGGTSSMMLDIEDDDDDDDIMPADHIRSEELIQLLDFATQL